MVVPAMMLGGRLRGGSRAGRSNMLSKSAGGAPRSGSTCRLQDLKHDDHL